jgi:NAD(P)-dependent dehydrogenase (short-subunit alcohol dehydrogenase family)
VNCICPGYIETDMTSRLRTQRRDPRLRGLAPVPLGRAGSAEEIANTALYLASDLASFVTGIALPVDGGSLAE